MNACVYSASFGTVQHFYNVGNVSCLLNGSEPYLGYSDISVNYADGVLKCSFTRLKSYKAYDYADLGKNQYYLLFSYGDLSYLPLTRQLINISLPTPGPVPIYGKSFLTLKMWPQNILTSVSLV